MKKYVAVFAALICILMVITSCNAKTCEHEWGEWTVTAEATCEAAGSRTRACSLCEQTQTEAIPEQHALGVWAEAVSPTCTENGVKAHYTCGNCGKHFDKSQNVIEDLTIPAAHNYVDGLCTVCGDTTSCTHAELHTVKVNLADYGACGGVLIYESCNCGSVKTMDETFMTAYLELSMEHCDFSGPESDPEPASEEAVTENVRFEEKCVNCGLSITSDASFKSSGCSSVLEYKNLTYSINGKAIVGGMDVKLDYDKYCSNIDYAAIPGEDWGACPFTYNSDLEDYGFYAAFKCLDCGSYALLSEPYLGQYCDVTVSETINTVNGREYVTKTTGSCLDCGLSYVYEACTTRSEAYVCATATEYTYTVYRGSEVVFEASNNDLMGGGVIDHEVVSAEKLLGDTCEDGVEVTERCTRCDYVYSYTADYCSSEDTVCDLSEYTSCGGSVSAEICTVCGDFKGFTDIYDHLIGAPNERWEDMGINCILGNAQIEYTTVDGVEHKISTFACINCDIEFITEKWDVAVSECTTDHYVLCSIRKGEQIILSETVYYSSATHDYEFTTATLLGENCEDGWMATYTCSVCGDVDERYESGCYGVEEYYDIDEKFGVADQAYMLRSCAICGKIQHFSFAYVEEINGEKTYYECESMCKWTNDGSGIDTCGECGAMREDSITESDPIDCSVTVTEKYKYYTSEGTYVEYEITREEDDHEYDYEYIANGENCEEDGYTEIVSCLTCGNEISIDTHYGHHLEYETVYKYGDYNIVTKESCTLCDHERYEEDWFIRWDKGEDLDDGWYLYSVPEDDVLLNEALGLLQMRKKIEYSEKDENCNCIRTTTAIFYENGVEAYRYVNTEPVAEHDYDIHYTLTGTTCNDGECYKTYVCKDCEYRYTERCWGNYENRLWGSHDLTKYGVTDGAVNVYGCVCGEEKRVEIEGEFDYSQIDNDGNYLNLYTFTNDFIVAVEHIYAGDDSKIVIYIGYDLVTGESIETYEYASPRMDEPTPEIPDIIDPVIPEIPLIPEREPGLE